MSMSYFCHNAMTLEINYRIKNGEKHKHMETIQHAAKIFLVSFPHPKVIDLSTSIYLCILNNIYTVSLSILLSLMEDKELAFLTFLHPHISNIWSF